MRTRIARTARAIALGTVIASTLARGEDASVARERQDLARAAVDVELDGGRPTLVRLPKGSGWRAAEAASAFAREWGLASPDKLVEERSEPAPEGGVQKVLRQYHRGVPILYSDVNMVEVNGEVTGILGGLVPGLDLSPDPDLDHDTAFEIAVAAAMNEGFAVETDPARAKPGELVFASEGDPRSADQYLAWRFFPVRGEGLPSVEIRVDAQTGAVRRVRERLTEAWVVAPAMYCTVPVSVDVTPIASPTGTLNLLTSTAKWKITTKDARNVPYSSDGVPVESLLRPAYVSSGPEYVTAHWATYQFFDFLQMLAAGRQQLDNKGKNGEGVTVRVNACSPVSMCGSNNGATNASYFGAGRLMLGGGAGGNPWVDPDIVAHELTHGVANYVFPGNGDDWGFFHEGESGAIDEGISDIFALTLKNFPGPVKSATPAGLEWFTAGQLLPPEGLRRADSPDTHVFRKRPRKYLTDPFWGQISPPCIPGVASPTNPNGNDNCFVHQNMTVVTHWYYNLINGAAADFVESMPQPLHKGFQVTYGALSGLNCGNCVGVPKNASFLTFKAATEGAAKGITASEDSELYYSVSRAWESVGVGSGPKDPFSYYAALSPGDTEVDVEPWPASLAWEKRSYETEWEIQISTQDSFPAANRKSLIVSGNPGKNVYLNDETSYYWRVRATKPAVGNWRGTYSFVTKSAVPSGLTPAAFADLDAWKTDLAWSAVKGATGYDVEVSKSIGMTPTYATSSNQAPAKYALSFDGSENGLTYYWRVRARSADAMDSSEWTSLRSFDAYLPQVKPTAPASGAVVYPWSVSFTWPALKGATQYKLEYGANANALSSSVTVPAGNAANLSVSVPFAADGSQPSFAWRVRAWGGPSNQEGLTSAVRVASIDEAATKVGYIAPYPLGYLPYGGPFNASWNLVSGATSYTINVREMKVDGTPGPAVLTKSVAAAGRAPGQQVAQILPVVDPPYGTYGYFYDIQAFGPNNLPGKVVKNEAFAAVQPDPATALAASFDPAQEGDTMAIGTVSWQSSFAPLGYNVRVYHDHACTQELSNVPVAATAKNVSVHSVQAEDLALATGEQYGTRIETKVPPVPAFQSVPLVMSACLAVSTPAFVPPPLPTPTIESCSGKPYAILDPWGKGSYNAAVIWAPVTGATSYHYQLNWSNGASGGSVKPGDPEPFYSLVNMGVFWTLGSGQYTVEVKALGGPGTTPSAPASCSFSF